MVVILYDVLATGNIVPRDLAVECLTDLWTDVYKISFLNNPGEQAWRTPFETEQLATRRYCHNVNQHGKCLPACGDRQSLACDLCIPTRLSGV